MSNWGDLEPKPEEPELCPFCGGYGPRKCGLREETDGACPWEEMQDEQDN